MKLIFMLIMCSFFLAVLPPVLLERGDIDLTIEGEVLSARLGEIPLKIIFEMLGREGRIWLKEGLNRILTSMNYSPVFNRMDESIL